MALPDTTSQEITSGYVYISDANRGGRYFDLRELWAYRELLWVFTAHDIKVRYKQTVLGITWAVIQPVMIQIWLFIIPVIYPARLVPDRAKGGPVSTLRGTLREIAAAPFRRQQRHLGKAGAEQRFFAL